MRFPLYFSLILVFFFGSLLPESLSAQNYPEAKEIIRKAEEKLRGKKTLYSEIAITIVRPKWQREMGMKSWSKGTEQSLILITSPAKDKGTVFLKRDKEAWNWIPSIERTIKLPPSMMMQSWMGTDLTNDDLLRESNNLEDYEQKVIGDTTLLGRKCWKLELIPHLEAAVVWGKVLAFIDQQDYLQLRAEYYDEDDYLINVMNASDIKVLGGQMMASRWEMIPVEKKGHKTVMEFKKIVFDQPMEDDFFSRQNMKRVK